MLPNLIKLLKRLRDVDIANARVDIVATHIKLKLRLDGVGSRFLSDCDGSCAVLSFSCLAKQLCLLIDVVVICSLLQQWCCECFVILLLFLVVRLNIHLVIFDGLLGRYASLLVTINRRNL